MTDPAQASAERLRHEKVIRQTLQRADPLQIDCSDEGWDSRVYLVNGGEAVFKFPRSSIAARLSYRQEIEVLELLATPSCRSDVRLPVVRWVGADFAWFGYKGIVGTPLSQIVGEADKRTREAIGTALGEFLLKLHRAELADVPIVNTDAEIAEYTEKFRLGSVALDDALSADELRSVERFILEEAPDALRDNPPDLKLCHGDLGPWNIIVADDGATGVIDLGDACYCDPSIDFSGFGDEVIFESAARAYGADERLRKRARVRSRALPLLDIPYYLGKSDVNGVRACIELVRALILREEIRSDARFLRD